LHCERNLSLSVAVKLLLEVQYLLVTTAQPWCASNASRRVPPPAGGKPARRCAQAAIPPAAPVPGLAGAEAGPVRYPPIVPGGRPCRVSSGHGPANFPASPGCQAVTPSGTVSGIAVIQGASVSYPRQHQCHWLEPAEQESGFFVRHPLRNAFREHDAAEIGRRAGYAWHDGGIDNAQPIKPVDPATTIDHGHAVAG